MSNESGSTEISLPLIEEPPRIARSRMSKRRFTVLVIVQLLIIAHIVQWLVFGTTIAPIEPSEGMETVKYGVITAGFVFFVLMLASTAIFGRWFCGWGCHVLLLQDASAKLLHKLGLKPKPFRSRLLMLIPLILGLYMFVWPLVYRFIVAPIIGRNLEWPGFSTHLITTEFWSTFPGWLVAIPFLFICGFGIVYFLGMKGYCTYGCPYGGFFAPVDEIATGRIRVTDACQQCGHCTAVCTSNVRVHEEVHDFKMVVDPGCMKCMDCVSVCPNDALYYGFGKPAIRVDKSTATKKRKWDLTWGEEIAFAGLALLVFLSVRGAYSIVSLLFASGVTAIVVFLTFKAWKCMKARDVRIHGWQLKRAARLKPLGGLFLAGIVVMLALVAHTGVVNAAIYMAEYHDGKVTTPAHVVFSSNPVIPEEEIIHHARTAREWYELASYMGEGGIGLAWPLQPAIDNRIGWMLAVENRRDEAEAHMRESIDRYGLSPEKAAGVARLLRARTNDAGAAEWYRNALEEFPDSFDLLEEYVLFLESTGRQWEAITYLRERLSEAPPPTAAWLDSSTPDIVMIEQMRTIIRTRPHLLGSVRRLSILLMNNAETPLDLAAGIRLIERTLDIDPLNPFAYRALALGYVKQDRLSDAAEALRTSVRLEPNEPALRQQLVDLLSGMGRLQEADEVARGIKP
jgi:polyferredoxin/tetratricopeptide (TPR) repeat protein